MSAPQTEWVSVIAPCRNERASIDAFCDSVASQALPSTLAMEVLIADGLSDDGTREALAQRMARDARFVMVDNPGRIVSAGLNACLAKARGAWVVRMDIHSTYAPDYVAQCVATLQSTGADNVGGPWRAEGVTPMQRAVAAAFQSRWVAGGARSRQLDFSGWVDTVYLGAWPRSSFERFGGFDDTLVRNQDDEHNLRMTKGGGRVWQSAAIRSSYQPRGRLGQVARQYMQYGYWKPFVMRKHGQAGAWRHRVPGALVAALLVLGLFTLLRAPGAGWAFGALWATYLTLVFGLSLDAVRTAGWALLPRVVAVVVTYHLSYGWGSLRGWWDAWVRRAPNPRFGTLTR